MGLRGRGGCRGGVGISCWRGRGKGGVLRLGYWRRRSCGRCVVLFGTLVIRDEVSPVKREI